MGTTKVDWKKIEWLAEDGGVLTAALLELRDRIAALEATPAPAPPPPVRGVTVEELADILEELRMARALAWRQGWRFHAARGLLNHSRLGPLLRGESAPAKRVELPEEPPAGLLPLCDMFEGKGGLLGGWTAARAEVARQQGEA